MLARRVLDLRLALGERIIDRIPSQCFDHRTLHRVGYQVIRRRSPGKVIRHVGHTISGHERRLHDVRVTRENIRLGALALSNEIARRNRGPRLWT